MSVRERINRVKIEKFRLSGVFIDPTVTIYQGDLVEYNTGTHVAQGAAPSSVTVLGMSETTNPIGTLGSSQLLSDLTNSHINVIQQGLVELIAEESVTLFPFDLLRVGNTDAQHVAHNGANAANKCAIVDPKWATSSGKAVVTGSLIRCWLQIRPTYAVTGEAATAS
jgi:hypothetical protein